MAESFAEAKSALDEVFRLYKWRRHAKGFPEEAYLLLSRCAYVCFSLWRADQESQGDLFRRSPPPMVFWVGLNFGDLRGSDHPGSVSPADTREAHLTNDTKWFAFWMKTLELSDPRGAPIYREFSRHILACVGHGNLLEVKTRYRSRKALDSFLKQNEAGGVLLHTVSVLEDVIQAILRYFSTLDGRTRVLEKIAVLMGLLGEMRQIIVWETPASGPYSPSADGRWKARSLLPRLSRHHRAPGVLTVIPKREGGEIVCICSPPSNPKDRQLSWVRKIASLKETYEEALFATWSYDTGEHRKNPQRFPGETAHWTVQYAEAQRLETLSRQVDLLLAALQGNPRCQRLVEAVRRILRNGSPRWKNTVLPWTYVKQLDELLGKLVLVIREASTLGGEHAAERIVAQTWGSEEAPTGGVGPNRPGNCQGPEVSRQPVPEDMTFALREVKLVLPKANLDLLDQAQSSSGPCVPPASGLPMPEAGPAVQNPEAEAETTVEKPPEQAELSGGDPRAAAPAQVREENPACATVGTIGPERQLPPAAGASPAKPSQADVTRAVIPAAPEEPAPKPAPGRRTMNERHEGETAGALLVRLREHHASPGGTSNTAALSAAELQRDLGWNQSQVQRAMKSLFGPKPFGAYKQMCANHTIAAFLDGCATGVRQPDYQKKQGLVL